MAISIQDFTRVLLGLQQLRPFAKQLDDAGLGLAWLTWPEQAKRELTVAQLGYAAGQMLLDPNPPKEMAIHLALLRYVYRCRDGAPAVEWGLKADLAERMQLPGQFHADPLPGDQPQRLQGAGGDALRLGGR